MGQRMRAVISGGLAGLCNGFFGGGGGSILVPCLTKWCHLSQREAFATSVAVIFPLCILSAGIYLWRSDLSLVTALPYLVGGSIGGFLGGKYFKQMNVVWLRKLFGLLLLYGGVRCFL